MFNVIDYLYIYILLNVLKLIIAFCLSVPIGQVGTIERPWPDMDVNCPYLTCPPFTLEGTIKLKVLQ